MENSSNNSMVRFLLLLIIVLLIGGGAYWWYGNWRAQRSVDKVTDALTEALEKSGVNADVDVDADSSGVNAQIGNINISAGAAVKVPDDFPTDMPLYPGSKVTAATSASTLGSMSVGLTTADAMDKVGAYYAANMPAQGWAETSTYATGTGQTQLYQKDNRTATVTVTSDGQGLTAVMLGVVSVNIPGLGL